MDIEIEREKTSVGNEFVFKADNNITIFFDKVDSSDFESIQSVALLKDGLIVVHFWGEVSEQFMQQWEELHATA